MRRDKLAQKSAAQHAADKKTTPKVSVEPSGEVGTMRFFEHEELCSNWLIVKLTLANFVI